ncbi:MAG: DUF4115 domain-containing protein [Betaproteobacteria bacterium]|nr:DUF4115 domain-containing protein [Betaproteobacteria bacterium]
MNKSDHKPSARPEGKRVRKRATPQPQPQPVANDLLTVGSAPHVPAAVPSAEKAVAAGVTAALLDMTPPASLLKTAPAKAPADPVVALSSLPRERTIQKGTPSAIANSVIIPVARPSPAAEEPNAPSKTLPEGNAGALLKTAREAAGLSIDNASRLLKLAPRQIQALEQQDFDLLPPRTFVRGFIRNYARLLNIDADTVLGALPPEDPQVLSPAAFSVKKPMHTMSVLPSYDKKPSNFWKGLSVVVVLAVLAGVLYSWPYLATLFHEHQPKQATTETVMPPVLDESHPSVVPVENDNNATENGGTENSHVLTPVIAPLSESPADSTTAPITSPAPEAPKPTPVPAPFASPSAASGNAELALRFSGDSWVEVRDKSTKVIYSALAKGGSEKSLIGEPPFSLVLGNSSVVTVTWRGAPVDLSSQSKQGVARLTLP